MSASASASRTINFTRNVIARAQAAGRFTQQTTVRQFRTQSSVRVASAKSPVETTATITATARLLTRSSFTRPMSFPSASRLYTSMASTSTPEPKYVISDLSDDDYHTVSDACMERMVEYFEDLGDEHEIPGYDVEYQSGVMNLKLGDNGTYVVNKQPPNKQLWLSSPVSGPKRYDYDTKHQTWFYNRDHHSLKYLLDTEITTAIGIEIDVPLDGAHSDNN